MSKLHKKQVATLLTSVFIISICSILYELLISSVSSYFQGSSILHFSLVIGLFLSSMGLGSFLSKFVHNQLLDWFIRVEVILSIIGGFSTFVLYFAFSITPYFYGIAFSLIVILGILIGIEIPILTRIMRQYDNLQTALANILSFDYLGALIASIAFPLLLLPVLGVMRTAFAVGLLNLIVAFVNTLFFKKQLETYRQLVSIQIIAAIFLISGLVFSFQINDFFEQFLYRDHIMLSQQSQYQKLVVTRWNNDTRLFINGNLQFSTRDEYRYHESLVHIPMAMTLSKERILVLGGGEGLAVREVLKHKDVGKIEIIDLDPLITNLGKNHPVFKKINKNSMNDPKVIVYNQDAYKFIEESSDLYNVIIIDLPDPNNTSLGKLYSKEFYELLSKRTAAGGVVVTQSASPYFATDAFWCINHTMEEAFDTVLPYSIYMPTFGQWGFNMAFNSPSKLDKTSSLDTIFIQHFEDNSLELSFLKPRQVYSLFHFGNDIKKRSTEINKLSNQVLLQYYEKGWNDWR